MKTLLISTLFFMSFSLFAQKFESVKSLNEEVKALQKEVDSLQETGADNIYIRELQQTLETKRLELDLTWEAYKGQYNGSPPPQDHKTETLFQHLNAKFLEIEEEWGESAAMKLFNLSYGDKNLPYTFEGYIVEIDGYIYLRPNPIPITTTLEAPTYEMYSIAEIRNDTLLFNGNIYLKSSLVSPNKPYDNSKARRKAENQKPKFFSDTSLVFENQYRKACLDSINLIRQIEELEQEVNNDITEFQHTHDMMKNKLKSMGNKISKIKKDALAHQKKKATEFFTKAWESSHVIVDGQLEVTNSGESSPYFRLRNWSIRIKNEE